MTNKDFYGEEFTAGLYEVAEGICLGREYNFRKDAETGCWLGSPTDGEAEGVLIGQGDKSSRRFRRVHGLG